MKPYFTKYVLVEGEMKEGDIAYFTDPDKDVEGFPNWTCYGTVFNLHGEGYEKLIGIDLGHTTTWNDPKCFSKVKLFLCSRDIQVGDKAKNIKREDVEFVIEKIEMGSGKDCFPKEMLVWYKHDSVNYWLLASDCYKVIGEVSPNATWVKEGDEFDEKETLHVFFIKDGLWTKVSEKLYKEYIGKQDKKDYFMVKGPCGHFH